MLWFWSIMGGTEEEILDLAKEIKNVVRDQFGMELEPEVEVVGGA